MCHECSQGTQICLSLLLNYQLMCCEGGELSQGRVFQMLFSAVMFHKQQSTSRQCYQLWSCWGCKKSCIRTYDCSYPVLLPNSITTTLAAASRAPQPPVPMPTTRSQSAKALLGSAFNSRKAGKDGQSKKEPRGVGHHSDTSGADGSDGSLAKLAAFNGDMRGHCSRGERSC